MTEVSRPVGRPPKVRPEAAPALTEQEVHTVIAKTLDPELVLKPVDPERMIEVEMKRKYAPGGQKTEIMATVPAGTVLMLPVLEATRALKKGIAVATDRTFES
jgi:hypothetical protein